MNNESKELVQAKIIAFTKVGIDYLKLLEKESDVKLFITECLKVLPSIYSQIINLPDTDYFPGDDFVEEYITEEAYELVKCRIKTLLGEHDRFLTTFDREMQYSDTPLIGHISESLADVYQHVGNLLGVIRDGSEEALDLAIGRCKLYWKEYFGLQLISALAALHQVYTSEDFEDIDQENHNQSSENAFSFIND